MRALFGCFFILALYCHPAYAMPNPAAVACLKAGGSLTDEESAIGGTNCVFPDGKICNQWALFRGECPAGGVRLPENISFEERACLLSGGHYQSSQNQCKTPEGKTCPGDAFLARDCR